MSTVTDTYIPKYSLKETSGNGAGMFMIKDMYTAAMQHPDVFLTPHRKDFYFMALVKKGNSRHWIDMVPYTLKSSAFYFTIPHQVHVKEKIEPSIGKVLCFTEEFLAINENQSLKNLPIIQNPHNGHELILTDTDLNFVGDLMDKIQEEFSSKQDWRNEMLLAWLKVLLIYLSRLYNEQFKNEELSADRVLLKKFRSLIEENYVELHDVASYANMLNISAGHLGDIVKQQSGKTAIEHIHERLVLEARRLLFHTEQSIKEIAFQLGFEDAAYFNRFFKRLNSETPMQYRRDSRNMSS